MTFWFLTENKILTYNYHIILNKILIKGKKRKSSVVVLISKICLLFLIFEKCSTLYYWRCSWITIKVLDSVKFSKIPMKFDYTMVSSSFICLCSNRLLFIVYSFIWPVYKIVSSVTLSLNTFQKRIGEQFS